MAQGGERRATERRAGRHPTGIGLGLAGTLGLAVVLAGCGSVGETVSSALGRDGAGDFNGDGVGDLVVGMPFKDAGGLDDSGAVALLYGDAANGRPGDGQTRLLTRLSEGQEPGPDSLPEPARRSDRLGSAIVTGDFDTDGLADLAIGVPYADLRGLRDVGAVTVVYGDDEGGLAAGDAELWHQDKGGLPGTPDDNDLFGSALAVGDFNADGFEDLAVGVPFENDRSIANGGAVGIIFGSLGGLTDQRGQIWSQLRLGIEVQQPNALFGSALAAGDFDGNGVDDLAVGAPDETWERTRQAGAVSVIYGTSSGLSAADSTIWRQSNRYVMGGDLQNDGDRFGSALAAGDFNGDGLTDLAVGTPEDDWGEKRDTGTVNVLYSSPDIGITADGDEIWHQNRRGTGLTNEELNNFGAALAAGDFNGDGRDDLAVGIPGQRREGADRVGAAFVAYGSEEGLTPRGSQVWQEGLDGLVGEGQEGDEFGGALAAVDVNGDGYADLVVGAKGDRAGAVDRAGGVFLLFGGPGGLSASGSRVWHAGGSLGGPETEALFGAAVGAAPGAPRVMMEEEAAPEDEAAPASE